MLRKLSKTESVSTPLFADPCPYWTKIDDEVFVADTFKEIITAVPVERRKIDIVAVLELLQFNYILGDRTTISCINRMPWRATLYGDGKTTRRAPIPHKNVYEENENIAKTLEHLLEEELLTRTQNASKIYLLLSGGFDSRVIAGILKKNEKRIPQPIECVTWGIEDSKDVVYAKRIANWYDWKFTNLPYTAEILWKNIKESAYWGGAQISGVHLHNTTWFKNTSKNDVVLTGHYGGGIGRGGFGSGRLLNLELPKMSNTRNLINFKPVHLLYQIAKHDRARAWEKDESLYSWSKLELYWQENYVRRMINHIFEYVLNFCDAVHLFGSEKVVSYMWSLSPKCRTKDVFCQIFKNLDHKLYSLPWTRDGIAPDGTRETNINLRQDYHRNLEWITNDLKNDVLEILESKDFDQPGVFNPSSVKQLTTALSKNENIDFGIAENLTKLCSLEFLERAYQIQSYEKADLARQFLSSLVN